LDYCSFGWITVPPVGLLFLRLDYCSFGWITVPPVGLLFLRLDYCSSGWITVVVVFSQSAHFPKCISLMNAQFLSANIHSKFCLETRNMFLGSNIQELSAFRSHLPLIFIVSFLTSIVFLAIRSFAKRPDEGSIIPSYTPKTGAVGNYKKRWSYDNPNALREAYSKVRDRLRLFLDSRIH